MIPFNIRNLESPYFIIKECFSLFIVVMSGRGRRKRIKIAYEEEDDKKESICVFDNSETIKTEQIVLVKSDSCFDQEMGPPHWRQVYSLLAQYRSTHLAPVDTMGCTLLSPPNVPENIKRFHILLGLLLSSQTKDEITHGAMFRLHEHFSKNETNGLDEPRDLESGLEPKKSPLKAASSSEYASPKSLAMLPEDEIANLIHPVGFFRKKAHYIKLMCDKIIHQFHGDVPTNLKDIMDFQGIGPKMVM